ncbi:MAG: ATP-binding protein [Pseudomonadota bacterium]
MANAVARFLRARFDSERENLMLVARRSRFDALLRMSIFALLSLGLCVGFNDYTFVIWFAARVTTTVLAGVSISRFQRHQSRSNFLLVFFAYVLDAVPFFWLVGYLWLSFEPQYQLISMLMLAAGFIYSLTHRLQVPSLGLIYVIGIQCSFTLYWATLLIRHAEIADVALAVTVMGLQFYHALTMHETFSTLAMIDRNARRGEAAKRLEAMGRVAGGVAHIFNNHLATIVCGIDPARSALSGRDAAKGLQQALDAAQQAGTEVSHLLAYTRQFPMKPAPLRLERVLAELDANLRPSDRRAIRLKLDIEDDLPRVFVDPAQLSIALSELVKNAIEATASRVTFRAARSLRNAETIDVSVMDNGTGVSPDIAARIFEPFFSAPDSLQKPGLGLAMIRGFVEQSGGRVSLKTSGAVGATIVLSLPIYEVDLEREEGSPITD